MSFQVIQGTPSIAGRLGKGFAKGLEDTLPKEIERQRMSSGLSKLKEQAQSGADPLDLLSKAYTTPGVTPEMAQSIQPYLQNAAIRQRGQTQGIQGRSQQQGNSLSDEGQFTQSQGQPGRVAIGNDQPEYLKQFAVNTDTLSTQETAQAALKEIHIPTPAEKDNRAIELMNQDPIRFQNYDQAFARAESEANTFLAQQKENIERRTRELGIEKEVTEGLQQEVKRLTHKDPETLNNTIPGEVYDKILKQTQQEVRRGKNPKQANAESARRILALDKSINTLRNNIGGRALFSANSDDLNRDIASLRKIFAENDALELFKDEQKNYLDQGDHLASNVAWPPTKPLENTIKEISAKDSPKTIAAKLSDKITDRDSLFSIGLELNKKGIDDAAVMKEIQQLSNDGLVKLDQRQDKEVADYYPTTYTLGDIFISAIRYPTGMFLTRKEKVPFTEKVKHFAGKR